MWQWCVTLESRHRPAGLRAVRWRVVLSDDASGRATRGHSSSSLKFGCVAAGKVLDMEGRPLAYGKRNQAAASDFANGWFVATGTLDPFAAR
jgi:hypothetical protein